MAMLSTENLTSGGRRLKGIFAQGSIDLPLVTVVTAVFNGQPHVAGCLESVLNQDYPNIEHIILDGGSTDGTLDVLRRYDDRVEFWKSEPDKGVYDAWNKALTLARGEWICFLGADDEFLPGAIAAYMKLAIGNPDMEYLASRGTVVYPSGHERTYGRQWTQTQFARRMQALHVGSMHKRSMFEHYGTFNTAYRIVGDYEFLLRSSSALRFAFLETITVRVRAGGISDSAAALYEAHRAKCETGGLPRVIAKFDLYLALTKYKVRPLVHHVLIKLGKHRLIKN